MKLTLDELTTRLTKLKDLYGGGNSVQVAPTSAEENSGLCHNLAGIKVESEGTGVKIILVPFLQTVKEENA